MQQVVRTSDWEGQLLSKMGIPAPSLSAIERHQRRFAHRNEDTLFRRHCDMSGAPMISIYPEDSPYTVFSQNAWWSDAWSPEDFGRPFDFSRPFFPQFAELQLQVPRLGLMNSRAENSEYCHNTLEVKNCYLVFGGDYVQDSLYSYYNDDSNSVVDVYRVKKSELVYDSIDCTNCYNLRYSQYAFNCRDSDFLYDCVGCSSCIACFGLRRASYCIFNRQYLPEEYYAKRDSLQLNTWSGVERLRNEFLQFVAPFPKRAAFLIHTEECSGNRISEASHCVNCFDVAGPAQDIAEIISTGSGVKDSISSNNVGKAELMYEVMSGMEGYNCAFCSYAWTSSNCYYCDTIMNCTDVFASVGLRQAKNAIFNRSYTQHEYESLRTRIVAHMKETNEWGEFFPIEQSPFPYNHTLAQALCPVTEQEAGSRGWHWVEEETIVTTPPEELPDAIEDAEQSIIGKTLSCQTSGRGYKIIAQELDFYRKMQIPLPRHCFSQRNLRRLAQRSGYILHNRACCDCNTSIQSVFATTEEPAVLCEGCYQARYC